MVRLIDHCLTDPVMLERHLYTKDSLDAINDIAAFLALDDGPSAREDDVQLVVLAGNAVLPTIDAAFGLVRLLGCRLVITGGIGHSTRYLETMVTEHPTYQDVATAGRPEADILADLGMRHWGLAAADIIRETASTNCGENALFTKKLLDQMQLRVDRIVLIQDPTMQRRTDAAFRHAWRDSAALPTIINYPGIVPHLVHRDGVLGFEGWDRPGLWLLDRFVSLIMGEIPRLRDDKNGYGPRGQNFIPHVDVPHEVETAYAHLVSTLRTDAECKGRMKPGV